MFPDVQEIRKQRKQFKRHITRSETSPLTEFEDYEARVLSTGALEHKYKELIALGISIAQACYG